MTKGTVEEKSEQQREEKRTRQSVIGRAKPCASDSPVGPRAPRIGLHAPIAGGLHNALLKARDLGCDTVQIFSRNPRGWMARPLNAEEIERFRRVREETRISPVVIHCNYLVNLASANPEILAKSRASFREEVERGLALGADYLVLHPGSAKGSCEADAISRCAESLRAACAGLHLGEFRILLENTAGQGECIGHRFEHLREIMLECPELNLGVCFDTAHAFTAGYDLREEDGLLRRLMRLSATSAQRTCVPFILMTPKRTITRALTGTGTSGRATSEALRSRASRVTLDWPTRPFCSKRHRMSRATTRAIWRRFALSSIIRQSAETASTKEFKM